MGSIGAIHLVQIRRVGAGKKAASSRKGHSDPLSCTVHCFFFLFASLLDLRRVYLRVNDALSFAGTGVTKARSKNENEL